MHGTNNIWMPPVTEPVRQDIMDYIDDRRRNFLCCLVGLAGVLSLGVMHFVPELIFFRHSWRALAEAIPTLLGMFAGVVILFVTGLKRGYFGENCPMNDLRLNRYTVVRFTVCGKRAYPLPTINRYILTDENGTDYYCTSYLSYRDAEIGGVMYGVCCLSGFSFVPREFVMQLTEHRNLMELQQRLGEIPAQTAPNMLVPLPEMPEIDMPADALVVPERPLYRKPEQPKKVSLKKEIP